MTTPQIIEVIDSWNLTSRGIIADLRHRLEGLSTGSVIKSQTTGKEWRVNNRILFHHILDKQRKFPNEITTYTHSSFGSVDNMLASEKKILEREKQNIFQYQLKAVGHNSKPVVGDTLLSIITEKFACPCCGYKTFYSEPNGSYDICLVCFWENDPIQLDDPDYEGGANLMSLRQAQQNFLEFGACDRNMLPNVRRHTKDEERDDEWKPFDSE